jgi:hypothetical protein
MTENQSLIFENSTLEKTKMELLSKIEQFSAENLRHEALIEKQAEKIFDLSRSVEELDKIKKDQEEKIHQQAV